mgnify:CR=1 FL=1
MKIDQFRALDFHVAVHKVVDGQPFLRLAASDGETFIEVLDHADGFSDVLLVDLEGRDVPVTDECGDPAHEEFQTLVYEHLEAMEVAGELERVAREVSRGDLDPA